MILIMYKLIPPAMMPYVLWFCILFFGLGFFVAIKQRNWKNLIASLIFVVGSFWMLTSTGNTPLSFKAAAHPLTQHFFRPTYPGYKNPRKALTFAEKKDQVAIAFLTADDAAELGPYNGKVIFIMKNTKIGGYTFKHNGKYYYLLERITNWKEDDPNYSYQIDAIPIHETHSDIAGKYVNVAGYGESHAKKGLGDTFEDAP